MQTSKGTNVNSEDICFTPALELREMIRNKIVSPVEVVRAFLDRVEKINPIINAYGTVLPELALQSARQAESQMMHGDPMGPIHGVPFSVKDVTLTKGIRTTFGSKLYENFVPDEDALIVERLKKAGGIILGKTNCPEFAAGASTRNKVFGITRNPWNTTYSSGGSSGGAAAGVAAGIAPLATGNDLGGSLRVPASFCGVVGLRPSPGRIPNVPTEFYWDTLNVEGPIARTVSDTALMLDVISGPDVRSPVSFSEDTEFLKATKDPAINKLRVAWSDHLNLSAIEKEVCEVARSSIRVFQDLGCEVVEDAPDVTGAREIALVLRALRFVGLYQEQLSSNPAFREHVNPLIVGNIEQGLKYSIQDLGKAERQRSDLWQKFHKFFGKYDLLVTPTSPISPFTADTIYPTEIDGTPMQNYVDCWMMTYCISLTGSPAISVPCGWTKKGLPVGIQIISRYRGEATLFKAAAAFEAAAPWWDKRPSFSL